MRLLLDTCAFYWWDRGTDITDEARYAMRDVHGQRRRSGNTVSTKPASSDSLDVNGTDTATGETLIYICG